MRRIGVLHAIGAAVGLWLGAAQAQDLSALAYLDAGQSHIAETGGQTELSLSLTQPVPYRAFLLDQPPRLVMDFREVDFSRAAPQDLLGEGLVQDLRWGAFRPGWSRLVAELSGPAMIVETVELTEGMDGAAQINIALQPVDNKEFKAHSGVPESALWDLPQPAAVEPPKTRQTGEGPLLVVLDPGHGGIDPGAEVEGRQEAVLVLGFARELRDTLRRAGIRVLMTREENVFVPLETRITVARASGADLFLSLHADTVPETNVTGATIYLLDQEASDAASQKLAERHDRADLLAGVDLSGHDDEVATILMELARAETRPRSLRLAQTLAGAMKTDGIKMHRHAIQAADFSVLKSPDFPSALLELGFMSSAADRARLLDAEWRARMAAAILRGIETWAQADAAEARLLRQ
ncbi:N-acetylmuramoyl-L-alanine amidase [Thioclava sp. A2]|uniref:N-acetylmuramoyl-L-alanine amidase n=1 Tax=Thioclava sp. FCG-A2 TaxID=3080562 RepID=UPI0029529E1B|nr:N-acetylmuramoyl-L-alanine amidase [Thioclava sp. A2]MDV7269589.1 N-acetylmuramoyl-L-alanine amidase [Thioclava sp. A2]